MLEHAPAKRGRWSYEPKLNGWRSLIHCPSRSMWNRHGKPLSIAKCFQPVLDALAASGITWLDAEALERRVPVGKGSLIILDLPDHPGTYDERQQAIYDQLISPGHAESWGHEQFAPPPASLLHFAYTYSDSDSDEDLRPGAAWQRLQEINRTLGCELFEGLVAKRADSHYPIQLHSPDTTTPLWVKHRWHF